MTFEISCTIQAASGRMTHASVFLLCSHPEGSPHYYFFFKNYKTQEGAAPPTPRKTMFESVFYKLNSKYAPAVVKKSIR